MGYTPDLVVGTWMAHTGTDAKGNPIGRYPLKGLYGVTTSSYMFKDFLPIYYSGARKIPTFTRPPLMQGGPVCQRATPGASPTPNPTGTPSRPISPAPP